MDSPRIPNLKRAVITLLLLSLMSLSSLGLAQAQGTSPDRSITVVGYGKASSSAESALIQMVVSREDYGPPRAPNPNDTPGALEREAVGPVIAGLQGLQIPEEDIQVVVGPTISNFYGPGGRGVARIEVNIDSPTPERIGDVLDAATVGAAEDGMVLGLIGVGYSVSNCADLEREARQAALDDAWSRGELQAELMGMTLGDPIGATDIPMATTDAFNSYLGFYTPSETACSPAVPLLTSGSPLSTPPFDPNAAAEVSVYAQISVVFEAALGDEATPEA